MSKTFKWRANRIFEMATSALDYLKSLIEEENSGGLMTATRSRADIIEQELEDLIKRGIISTENLKGRVLDFGTGSGAGAHIIKKYGGEVTGLDEWQVGIDCAVEQGILLPENAVLIKDGFNYIEWLAQEQPESLDFVSAFWMNLAFPYEKMCSYASHVLKKGGQLLITQGSGRLLPSGISEAQEELQKRVGHLGRLADIEVTSPVSGKFLTTCAFALTKTLKRHIIQF